MEKIDIREAFRRAELCDGVHGIDRELLNEGAFDAVGRFADHIVGGLWDKNVKNPVMDRAAKVGNWFKEATGDIGHAIASDLARIAKNGDNAEKWTGFVKGDLAKHVNHGLTGKGGMPADFAIPSLKLPSGNTVHNIPLAWGICAQSSLCNIVVEKRDNLPSLDELLGTVEGVINIAAYIQGAKPYGKPPYDDICSFIATGGGKPVKMAIGIDEAKDSVFKTSMVALFQSGWRPTFDKMSGTMNVICSQMYIQSLAFLVDNKICTLTDRWYKANRHLWGWSGTGDAAEFKHTDDACADFEAYVSSHVEKGNSAMDSGPMTDAQVAVAAVDAIGSLAAGGIGESVNEDDGGFDDHGDPVDDPDEDPEVQKTQADNAAKEQEKNVCTISPSSLVSSIESAVKSFQSQKTKGNFETVKTAAKNAGSDKAGADKFRNCVKTFLAGIGATSPMSDALKKSLGSKADEMQKKIDAVNALVDGCKFAEPGNEGGSEA